MRITATLHCLISVSNPHFSVMDVAAEFFQLLFLFIALIANKIMTILTVLWSYPLCNNDWIT